MEPQENQEANSVELNEFAQPPVEVVKEGADIPPEAGPFINAPPIVQQEPAQEFVENVVADAPVPIPEPGPVEVVALDHFDQPFDGTQARSVSSTRFACNHCLAQSHFDLQKLKGPF